MIDAFEENELDLESNSKNESNELTLAAIKDYLISKGGKVKYSELFYHFKHQINDSQINGLIVYFLIFLCLFLLLIRLLYIFF